MKQHGARVLLAAAVAAGLCAQETGTPEAAAPAFPIAPLVELARADRLVWQPDWPDCVPADAFALANGAVPARAIRLRAPDGDLALERRGGLLTAFPCRVNGTFMQAFAAYAANRALVSLTLTPAPPSFNGGGSLKTGGNKAERPQTEKAKAGDAPAENADAEAEALSAETLRFDADGLPALFRLAAGGAYFFITIERGADETIETWFAAEEAGDGVPAAARAVAVYAETFDGPTGTARHIARLYPEPAELERRFYDGMGNVTGVSAPAGDATALYDAGGPRFWNGAALSRDGRGLTAGRAARAPEDADDDGAEIRYEYRFDARGNWIERQEIRLRNANGVLLPAPGPLVRRVIEYEGNARF